MRKLRDCADLVCDILAKGSGERWPRVVVRYILAGAPNGPAAEEVQRTMSDIAGSKAEEIVVTAAEKLFAKGMERGITTNQREAIVKVLRARFGEVPDEIDTAIRAETDPDTLDRLLELAARTEDLTPFQN